ncbi:hypothetical protein [Leuconostoc mesenteroides]|uniref:hypothetical protein n=1 Tax=Leuconostoc mesenteroides TaxID=1245 RepID=UPI0010AEE878|nr:hypothetical protein [Leuconostoc mesenteroides]TJY30610.1 hypothetical protein FCF26_05220 [Leuconostoc mesenteroides subsp. mesenteroides]
MIYNLIAIVTNADLMRQIKEVARTQSPLLILLSPLIVGVVSILTTLISNYYASRNMKNQINEQKSLAEKQYQQNEKLQKHDFINRLLLDKLSSLSAELPIFFRESFVLYIADIYKYYNCKKYYGISDEKTIKAGKDAIENNYALGNRLNDSGFKVKQLLAYSNDAERKEFDRLQKKITDYTVFGIDKYLEDIAKGIHGTLNPDEVKKEINEHDFKVSQQFFVVSKAIDQQIVELIQDLKN